ncbi:MAG: DNA-processing protein DprA [Gemmatimonadaceae bacterium]
MPSRRSSPPRVVHGTTESFVGPLSDLERVYSPSTLYVAGHAEWLREHPKVSVVGSREASADGLRRTSKLVTDLVTHGVIVVSGLAHGVDAMAHRTAMGTGGRTLAVLGTPLSQSYPAANRALQLDMMVNHAVVSQFPEDEPVGRRNFPIRNRTMALLVDASVIVEAGEGSGTLSQGWEALRLGRPLFLMRSILGRTDLSWPNTMLDYGAQVLDDVDDLLERLPTACKDVLAGLA